MQSDSPMLSGGDGATQSDRSARSGGLVQPGSDMHSDSPMLSGGDGPAQFDCDARSDGMIRPDGGAPSVSAAHSRGDGQTQSDRDARGGGLVRPDGAMLSGGDRDALTQSDGNSPALRFTRHCETTGMAHAKCRRPHPVCL